MRGALGLMVLGVPMAGGGATGPTFTVTTTAPAQTLTLYSLGVATGETVTIDWGDNTSNDYTGTAQRTHQYASAGEYTVTLLGSEHITAFDLRDNKCRIELSALWRSMTPSALSLRSVVVTGTLADLPRATTTAYLMLNNTQSVLTGDLADLPRVTNILFLYLYGTSSVLTGDLADLPRVTAELELQCHNTGCAITGDLADLPRVTNTLRVYLENTPSVLTGSLADLPKVNNGYGLRLSNTLSTLTGDLADLSTALSSIDLRLNDTPSVITGNFADLPSSLSYMFTLWLHNTASAITGNIADIPSVATYHPDVRLYNTLSAPSGGASSVNFATLAQLQLHDCGLSQAAVNDIIYRLYQDRALVTGVRNVTLGGTNATPSLSPHIDTYLPALFDAGWTITIDPLADNAVAPLAIPTYEGSGQVVHPDVYDAGSGSTWNGYRYWMAMTPYPGGDDYSENPSIVASNDGETWVVPAGLTNPIVPRPGVGYNSDPDILVDGSSVMWLFYRETNGSTVDTIYVLSSSDGVTWSSPAQILTGGFASLLSPAVIYDGSQYVMYTISATRTLERRTCATPNGEWSAATPCTVSGTNNLWHIDAIYQADSSVHLLISRDPGPYDLRLATSANGVDFVAWGAPILIPQSSSWDNHKIYRTTGVRTANGYDLWYSARNTNTTWWTAYTQLVFPP